MSTWRWGSDRIWEDCALRTNYFKGLVNNTPFLQFFYLTRLSKACTILSPFKSSLSFGSLPVGLTGAVQVSIVRSMESLVSTASFMKLEIRLRINVWPPAIMLITSTLYRFL